MIDVPARQKNSKVAFYSSVHQVIVVLSAILSLLLFSNQARANFQRGFFNIGFEEPVISNGAPCRVYVGDNLIEGWNTSHSPSSQGNSCPPGVHPALSPLLTGQAPIIELWKGPRDIVVGASSFSQWSGHLGETRPSRGPGPVPATRPWLDTLYCLLLNSNEPPRRAARSPIGRAAARRAAASSCQQKLLSALRPQIPAAFQPGLLRTNPRLPQDLRHPFARAPSALTRIP